MMLLKNMVQGTIADIPSSLLIQLWDHDVGTLAHWRSSSNFVYTFDRNGQRHYLRFIHETDNSADNIQAELDYMLYLLDEGYATVAPIRSKNGKLIEEVVTEHGKYYGVVFEQARGVHVPLDAMSDTQLAAWGRSLASLHRLSERYAPSGAARLDWADTLAFIASELQRKPRETGLLASLERLREQLLALPGDSRQIGLVHYDYETDNMFYLPEEDRYCAIDFDDAMVHWYMMDITRATGDILEEVDATAEHRMQQFISGYRSVRPLADSELALIPLFRRFADLYTFARLRRCLEGFEAEHSPDWAIRLRDKLQRVCDRIRSELTA